jgi:hypothetical protein
MNGVLWGWIVYVSVKLVAGQGSRRAFDASVLSLRLAEVRQNHAGAAHARGGSVHARKGLVAWASRAVRGCGYFFDRKPEARPYDEGELHKTQP